MRRDRTSEVKHLLETAYSTVVFYHEQALKGEMTDEQARKAASDAVRAMHYDAHNYFFIWDLDGNGIAHGGNSKYEGRNYLTGPDAENNPVVSYMVRQLVNVANSDAKEGLTTYRIPKAGQTVPLEKIAYNRLFEPWRWSVGTGAYIDDIDIAFKLRALQLFWIFLLLMVVASLVTYFVVHDLVLSMRRLSLSINKLTNGEMVSEIPDTGRHDEVGVMAKALLVLRDTSKEVSELKLDHLTGLPTRKLLVDRIRQAKVRSARNGMTNALLLLDLDKFKPLNDTHGHDAGDKLLKEVANRLSRSVRESDTVARLGGDEFVVLLVDLSTEHEKAKDIAAKIAEKILASLNQDYFLGHIVHHCTASIGVTLFMGKTVPADDLLKQADIAMYKSKISGSDCCQFFEDDNEFDKQGQINFEKEMRTALSQHQFVLHYQPQVTLDGQLLGCEALVRWQHPTRGIVDPEEFLPIAEKKGFSAAIGKIVLEQACLQLAEWSRSIELADLKISVNVDMVDFRRAEFIDNFLTIVQRTRVNPARLVLEISEHVLANNVPVVIEKMAALRKLGVSFSIHDFGMGYAPLSFLSELPIQEVKICPSFVQKIFNDTSCLATPKMILAIAASLGLNTVAVGVETQAQQDYLVQAGCNGFQGYLCSRPLAPEEFGQFFRARYQSGK